ncbi:MAG TPA: glycosyltransferase family protein [Verrucomicrobiae bacterium]|nr:glycosyltransferase family protein [Verrucomicrobiae bacterium]
MARVLYGVMGNTFGHVSRSLAVAGRLPEHEFHFVGGERVPEVLRGLYPVLEVPVAHTVHQNQRVSVPRTCRHLARCTTNLPRVTRQILDLIDRWQPDVAICDREFFLPHAANRAGLPIFALDHSHVLQVCRYHVPPSEFVSWALGRLEDALFFNHTRHNLVTSFFHPELKPDGQNELLPPILRPAIRDLRPTTGDHIFIYQSTATFPALLDVAHRLPRPAVVYGVRNETATEGNLTFKPFHKEQILADLAASAFAVTTAGHNLICEALALGKPVLCFPIAGTFEQFINAAYIRHLGYGDFSTTRHPSLDTFTNFESRLDHYRRQVQTKFVDGTDTVIARVRALINLYSQRAH